MKANNQTKNDWDKSLFRSRISLSTASSTSEHLNHSTLNPDFTSFEFHDNENIKEIKDDLATIKLILKELSENRNNEVKRVENLITRVSRLEQKQYEKQKQYETEKSQNKETNKISTKETTQDNWNFPKSTARAQFGSSFNLKTTNRFAPLSPDAENMKREKKMLSIPPEKQRSALVQKQK